MHFIFVRHGETDWNKQGKAQGWLDIPLNETGRCQAHAVAERFQVMQFDKVYVSPLKRAYETAKIITDQRHDLITLDDLKEINYGDYNGKQASFIREQRIPGTRLWHPSALAKNPESFCSLLTRCKTVFQKIISDLEKNKDVLIVAHGGIYRALAILTNNYDATPAKNCTPYRFALNADNRWEITELL